MPATDTATGTGLTARVRALRARVRRRRAGRVAWRAGVIVLGVAAIAGGIVLLVIPGPGWLVIFFGLGVLATEFDWARRLLQYARRQVARWTDWVKRQNRLVQLAIGAVSLLFLGALLVLTWLVYF